MVNSIKELEDKLSTLPIELAKTLPLEAILKEVRGKHFEADGEDYLSTVFAVGDIEYFVSVKRGGGLSLYRGKPKDRGVLLRDYHDSVLSYFFAGLKTGLEDR